MIHNKFILRGGCSLVKIRQRKYTHRNCTSVCVPLGAPLQPSPCAHGKDGSTEQPTHGLLSHFSFRNLVALFSQKKSALVYA